MLPMTTMTMLMLISTQDPGGVASWGLRRWREEKRRGQTAPKRDDVCGLVAPHQQTHQGRDNATAILRRSQERVKGRTHTHTHSLSLSLSCTRDLRRNGASEGVQPPSPFRAGPRELQGVGATQEAAPFACRGPRN